MSEFNHKIDQDFADINGRDDLNLKGGVSNVFKSCEKMKNLYSKQAEMGRVWKNSQMMSSAQISNEKNKNSNQYFEMKRHEPLLDKK